MVSVENTLHHRQGFTLIELMVVMLLIALMLAVAVPKLDTAILQDPKRKTNRWMINTTRALRTAAIEKQKIYSLVIDIDSNRMYPVGEEMDEEARASAAEKAFKLPSTIRIVDVQFPNRERTVSGNAEILYYPGGYSDMALINLEDDDAQRFSYKLEPLLPKIRVLEEWISY